MFDFLKRKKTPPPTAAELHQAGRVAGQAGNFQVAIEKLKAAITLEPNWAYPYYDLAFTYLLMGENANALEYYLKTDALEPRGFFTCKTAIYSLKGEELGKFPKGTYRAYMEIEWANTPAEKLRLAQSLTSAVPNYAPAFKELALLTEDVRERVRIIREALFMHPDPETAGVLDLNMALLLHANQEQQKALDIVRRTIADPKTTRSNLAIAEKLLLHFQGASA